MKKIVLSLASVLAATAFAPEASAVPAFARQTGSACVACHFQSYPALTSFGKAFKTSGFTMMGAQGKVEGEHGLSLPNTLNMAVYFQARYKKTNGGDTAALGNNNLSTNSGRIDLPDEFSLFAGGRVAENIGALLELALTGGTSSVATGALPVPPATAAVGFTAGGTGVAGFKLPVMFDVGSVKLGVVPFTVGGLGPQYGYDVFATGSTANGRVIENGLGYSASMYLGTNGNASGAAIVVANQDFHVSYTPWVQAHNATNLGATGTKLGGNYIRAAWTPNMGGWDLGLGVQHYSGNALKGIDTTTLIAAGVPVLALDAAGNPMTRNSATVIDFQGQGEVAAMPLGIYGSYGYANGQVAGDVNVYNGGPERKSAFGLLADLGVIPNTLNLQLGFMRAKTGANIAAVAGTNESDNSYTLGVRYKLAQNVKLGLAYTKFSGDAYNGGNTVLTGTGSGGANGAGAGDSLTNFIFSAAF